LQDLLSIAEASDYELLSESVSEHVAVTAENRSSWLEWLNKVHSKFVGKIEEKVKRMGKSCLEEAGGWDKATIEELVILDRVAKRQKLL
jgi:hypothetical protein